MKSGYDDICVHNRPNVGNIFVIVSANEYQYVIKQANLTFFNYPFLNFNASMLALMKTRIQAVVEMNPKYTTDFSIVHPLWRTDRNDSVLFVSGKNMLINFIEKCIPSIGQTIPETKHFV